MRYLHERCGPGTAVFGWSFETWYRQIHAAHAELGLSVGPEYRQTFPKKVRASRYRSRSRSVRLQGKKWRRRARPNSSGRDSLDREVDRLAEILGDWHL